MAIIFFTNEATSPLFSPVTAPPVSSRLDPRYPVVSQLAQILNIHKKSPSVESDKDKLPACTSVTQLVPFTLVLPSRISVSAAKVGDNITRTVLLMGRQSVAL